MARPALWAALQSSSVALARPSRCLPATGPGGVEEVEEGLAVGGGTEDYARLARAVARHQAGRAVGVQRELGHGAAGGATEGNAGGAIGQDGEAGLAHAGRIVEDEAGGAVRGDAERTAEIAGPVAQVEPFGVERLRHPGDDGRLTEESR